MADASASPRPHDEPPVGFVWHYPYIPFQDELIAGTGANALINRGNMGAMTADGKMDLSVLEKQLSMARALSQKAGHPVRLMQLLEANPVHMPGWVQEEATSAGQSLKGFDGGGFPTPSMSSTVAAGHQERFVRHIAAAVAERNSDGTVASVIPGCEWWYPSAQRGSDLDQQAFRKWLERKYGAVEALNRRWGTLFVSFDQVLNPGIGAASSFESTTDLAAFAPSGSTTHDAAFSTPQPHWIVVDPGATYTFSAWVRTSRVVGEGAHLSVAWSGDGGSRRIRDSFSRRITRSADWEQVVWEVIAPPDADRAWLLLKLRGSGAVWFDDVSFVKKGSAQNLAPDPSLEGRIWRADNWTGGKQVRFSTPRTMGRSGSPCVAISAPPAPEAIPLRAMSATGVDASNWACEYLADYIDSCAALTRRHSPDLPIATYLTFAFSNMLEWDYAYEHAVSLGSMLPRLKNVDIIGMQICSADADPIRVTGALDIARKYGKQLWSVDLLDFTSGVAVGPDAMRRVSLSSIQHGGRGIFYYCWNGTKDYDFYPGMSVDDLKTMIEEAKAAARATQGMKLRAPVCLIQPISPSVYTMPDGGWNDWRDFGGLYKALEDLGAVCDVYTLEEIREQKPDLLRYSAVVLPDCAFVPRDVASAIARASRQLPVIHSGRWAVYDETGVAHKDAPPLRAAKLDNGWGGKYLGPMLRTTHAGNTPPLFISTATPSDLAATRSKLLPQLRKLLAPVLASEPASLANPQPGLSMSTFESETDLLLFLVNRTGKPASASIRIPADASGHSARYQEGFGSGRPVWDSKARVVRVAAFSHAAIIRLSRSVR